MVQSLFVKRAFRREEGGRGGGKRKDVETASI